MVEAPNEVDPVKLYNKVFYKDKERSNLVNYPLNYLSVNFTYRDENEHPSSSEN